MGRIITEITPFCVVNAILHLKRVAAYARVSSGKDAMLHSLSAQVSYFSDYIQKRRDWTYAGVYIDEAVTGTKDRRAGFQKMMEDCRAGKIDMIIAKSISRFARNTLTLLETIRELRVLGIDVFFERENIHSISANGELMLTILASFAQEESLSVSENCKWRIRKRYENGEIVSLRFIYGYSIKKGVIEINQEQAEVVRMIFNDYIGGMGSMLIAKKLNEMGLTGIRGAAWSETRIIEILKNEKYIGDALLQKKYSTDHLTKKVVRNKGELPKYYAEKTHPAIIDTATFNLAQNIMAERRVQFKNKDNSMKHYPFTGKIRCGLCGKNYKRKTTLGKVAWNCATFLKLGKAVCHAKQIPESTLMSVTADVLGVSEFSEELFYDQIAEIRVPEFNRLVFVFCDGLKIEREWQDRSRRESWTPEMRQLARAHALKSRNNERKIAI